MGVLGHTVRGRACVPGHLLAVLGLALGQYAHLLVLAVPLCVRAARM